MKVAGATKKDVEAAARKTKVRICGLREGPRGSLLFTLATLYETPNAPWRRLSAWSTYPNGKPRTVPGRVCWHGHREFLLRLFELCPEATVSTSMATYGGLEEFARTHHKTVTKGNTYGGAFAPVGYNPDEAPCTCSWRRRREGLRIATILEEKTRALAEDSLLEAAEELLSSN